jgi:glycosyltransferase involved in cell wall biosynthesis
VERHVYETGRRIAAAGVDVSVLTTDRTRSRLRYEEEDGMKIQRVPAWPSRRDYYVAPAVYRRVTTSPCDIVHVQSWHTAVAPLAMVAASRATLPFIVTPHAGGHSSAMRQRLRPVQRRMLAPLLRRAAQVVALARFECDQLLKELQLNPERITIIPNGSDLLPRARHPRSSRTQTIVSIGRLERYKGHHRIIEALPEILEKRPEARLFIAGDGPYEAALWRLAGELGVEERVSIKFFPISEREQLASLLAEAGVVVLLSEYETHPIAVLEAAALGSPVLVADAPGLAELAHQGVAQLVSLTATPAELAAAILRQLDAPAVARHIDLPTWDDCANALLQLYEIHVRSSTERRTEDLRGRDENQT